MQIVNPLYDHAFKYLMQNERFAKRILEIILEDEILELSISNQETVVPDEKRGLTLFRLDFRAIMRSKDGSTRKVLIELQKSKFATDIVRFRNYLGANYLSSSSSSMEIPNEVEEVEEVTTHTPEVYPIVTIYILGYSLKDLPYLAVSVKRKVINSIDQSEVESSSFFINHLTHESHILQITRLPEKRSTTLERFLSFFNQAWISDRNFILDLEEVPEEFSDIAHYLQGVVGDAAFRRRLEAEEEIDAIFNAQEAKYQKEIASAKAAAEDAKLREEAAIHREAEAKLREDEAKLREEEAKLREEEAKLRAEEAKLRAEEALRREDVAKHRESEAMLKLARNMKKWGEPAEDIAKETGLDLDTISSL